MNPHDLPNDIDDPVDDIVDVDRNCEQQPRAEAVHATQVADEWMWRTCGAFLCV